MIHVLPNFPCTGSRLIVTPARRYFFASGFQFWMMVIGAAVLSPTLTLIRKRPSGATSYCCRYPVATVPPNMIRGWKRAVGRPGWSAVPEDAMGAAN